MDDELAAALCAAGLEAYRAKFVEEELTFALLRDMGNLLAHNLSELGLSKEESSRLAAVIFNRAQLLCREEPKQPLRPRYPPEAAAERRRQFEARVHDLQAELFADDLRPPSSAEAWSEEELRAFFESGGSKFPVWLPTTAANGSASQASPPPIGAVGPTIGTLPLKWQAHEIEYQYSATSTVFELKTWLRAKFDVPVERQRIVGWAPKHKRTSEVPDTLLRDLELGPRTARLRVMGTPASEAAKAEAELERGRRLSRAVQNDLRERPPMPRAPWELVHPPRSQDRRPIQANRGGGIFLDPTVWAVTEEEEERSRQRHGRGSSRHVVNPSTNRLEELSLANALTASEVPEPGPNDRIEDGPINIDLLGFVRGRCTRCERCPGYTRQQRDAATESDTAVLDCARCGCPSHHHQEI
jgi:hypothetical protein